MVEAFQRVPQPFSRGTPLELPDCLGYVRFRAGEGALELDELVDECDFSAPGSGARSSRVGDFSVWWVNRLYVRRVALQAQQTRFRADHVWCRRVVTTEADVP